MTLEPGQRLGPYEIVAPLGAGGMGEVYRAKDTRLGREVAVKVLRQHLSANPEVRARFEREAKAISSLNHPHICVLHDIGREDDTDYLVMELVEGESLARRLADRALPTSDTIRIALQIADALDRAHRAGIVHRDLKPGNIMVTKSGAKLMDFGLARATGRAGSAEASGVAMQALTQSPTQAQPLTAEGTIVGTFQYMAPEQLEGGEADARADLWALGCVLYEMATGRRAFEGSTPASLISSIMRDQPRPVGELAPLSPPALARLVGVLLAKDPDERLQSAHDVKLQLEWIGAPDSGAASHAAATETSAADRGKRKFGRGARTAWTVAVVAVAVAAVAWLLPLGRGTGSNRSRVRLIVPEPPNTQFTALPRSFAISPDGRTLAFVATDSTGTSHLWLRPLNGLVAEQVSGTDRADLPFWSPDSRALGFFADGKLKRIGVEGGISDVLCEAPDPRGATWSPQGIIAFAPVAAGALYQVSADGGAVTEIVHPDSSRGETALRFPQFLPDGRNFTFISLPGTTHGVDVHLGSIDEPGERRFLMRADAAPVNSQPGWLITTLNERLVALRFEAGAGEVVGKPVVLGDAPLVGGFDGTFAVSASSNGIMAYVAGRRSNSQLAWLNRNGRVETMLSLPVGRWEDLSLSPDARRAIVTRRITSRSNEMWIVDLASGQARRLPVEPEFSFSSILWSPDGQRVAFSARPRGPADLFVLNVDGGRGPELLYASPSQFKNPGSWSPDGKYLLFEQPSHGTNWDVWMVDVDGDREAVPLVQTPANEGGGYVSPDGRWLVYYSDEAGTAALYVRPFPGGGPRQLLRGTNFGVGGFYSVAWWSRDGTELLVRTIGGVMRAVTVRPGEHFDADPGRDLFRSGDEVLIIWPTADHSRFLATVQIEPSPPAGIVVDVNWTEDL